MGKAREAPEAAKEIQICFIPFCLVHILTLSDRP